MWSLVAATAAVAGVPVRLPATEEPSDWVGALALGGFDWSPSSGAIVVADRGGSWVVTVADGAGGHRTATVDPPRTPEAREDLVWLVVSLAGEVEAPVVVAPVPEPAPVPVPLPRPLPRPEPATVAGTTIGPGVRVGVGPPPPDEEPVVARVVPEPVVTPPDPPRPAPIVPPPAPAPGHDRTPVPAPPPRPHRRPPRLPTPPDDDGVRPWLRLAGGAAFRSGVDPRPTVSAASGGAWERQALGVAAAFGSRGQLPGVGASRTWSGFELAVEGWTGPRWVRAGAAGGAEIRRFFDGERVVASGAMPFVRADLAAELYLGRRIAIEPGLTGRLDLGVTEIRIGGLRVDDLPTRSLGPSLAVRWR